MFACYCQLRKKTHGKLRHFSKTALACVRQEWGVYGHWGLKHWVFQGRFSSRFLTGPHLIRKSHRKMSPSVSFHPQSAQRYQTCFYIKQLGYYLSIQPTSSLVLILMSISEAKWKPQKKLQRIPSKRTFKQSLKKPLKLYQSKNYNLHQTSIYKLKTHTSLHPEK